MPDNGPTGGWASLQHWFPRLVDAGVAVPRTELLHTDVDLIGLCDGGTPDGFDRFLANLTATCEKVGVPCFLRTGQGSGKHDWDNTCHVTDLSNLADHVAALVMWSELVDWFGLPYDVWVAREMLTPARVAFTCPAFSGMPVGAERRWWIADGQITGWHPYWPPEAFAGELSEGLPTGWEQDLAAVNTATREEIAELREATATVAAAFADCEMTAWSVDWMHTTRGWVCIDMAPAAQSWRWDDNMQPVP